MIGVYFSSSWFVIYNNAYHSKREVLYRETFAGNMLPSLGPGGDFIKGHYAENEVFRRNLAEKEIIINKQWTVSAPNAQSPLSRNICEEVFRRPCGEGRLMTSKHCGEWKFYKRTLCGVRKSSPWYFMLPAIIFLSVYFCETYGNNNFCIKRLTLHNGWSGSQTPTPYSL